jgi:hypothetical protein
MSDTVKVEFAYPYTDAAGKNHNADATASLPREEAKNLIHFGRARVANESAPKATAKKES